MLCQSFQSVARYLRFNWNTPEPYAEIFKERLFDYLGRLDDGSTDEALVHQPLALQQPDPAGVRVGGVGHHRTASAGHAGRLRAVPHRDPFPS